MAIQREQIFLLWFARSSSGYAIWSRLQTYGIIMIYGFDRIIIIIIAIQIEWLFNNMTRFYSLHAYQLYLLYYQFGQDDMSCHILCLSLSHWLSSSYKFAYETRSQQSVLQFPGGHKGWSASQFEPAEIRPVVVDVSIELCVKRYAQAQAQA